MVEMAPEVYGPYVVYENGKKVLYIQVIIALYGDPDSNHDGKRDPAWEKAYLKQFTFNTPMRVAWGSHYFVTKFWAHRLAGDDIVSA